MPMQICTVTEKMPNFNNAFFYLTDEASKQYSLSMRICFDNPSFTLRGLLSLALLLVVVVLRV